MSHVTLHKIGREQYIRMSDLKTAMGLHTPDFNSNVNVYLKDHKPLAMTQVGDMAYMLCISACHFIDWYLTHTYKLLPELRSFARQLGRHIKKKSKRKLSKSLRYDIAWHQDHKCRACGMKLPRSFQIDHIKALEDGGLDVAENLQALCAQCHAEKSYLRQTMKHPSFVHRASDEHARYAQPLTQEEIDHLHRTIANAPEEEDDDVEDENPQIFSQYFHKSGK